jgi:hypothetical protein
MISLTDIHVERYRSLYDFQVTLRPLTVLIGRNDAGKSSLLSALQLLLDGSACEGIGSHDWSRVGKATRFPRKLTISGTICGGQPLTIRRVVSLEKDAPAAAQLFVKEGSEWRIAGARDEKLLPSFYCLRPRTGALQEAFDPDRENNIFSLVKDWMPPALSQERNLHRLMRRYAPKQTNLKAYVTFFENEVYPALRMAFPSELPILLHPEYRSDTDRGRLMVREMPRGRSLRALFRLPLDRHGTGLISVVALILSIAVLREYHRQDLSGKPLIVAIEEPEVHLHPGAQRSLLGYLRYASDRHQTIITTHSPIFVDRVEPPNVVVLRRAGQRAERATKGSKLPSKCGMTMAFQGDHASGWKQTVDTLGIRLSDALLAGEVSLLVEGPTEAILLPAMSEALARSGERLIDFDRVFVVIGGGSSLRYMARVLQGFGNPTVVVLDSDESGQRMAKQLPEGLPLVEHFAMPSRSTLPAPYNQLKAIELEDLLDAAPLLDAFNDAFNGKPGFSFIPISYHDFQREQLRLLGKGSPKFGWCDTMTSILRRMSPELAKKPRHEELFSKAELAKVAAHHIRAGKLGVPGFYKKLFARVSGLLGV